jgi:hypothetical protein
MKSVLYQLSPILYVAKFSCILPFSKLNFPRNKIEISNYTQIISIFIFISTIISNIQISFEIFSKIINQSDTPSAYLKLVIANFARIFNIFNGIIIIYLTINFHKLVQIVINNLCKVDKAINNKNNRYKINLIILSLIFSPTLLQALYTLYIVFRDSMGKQYILIPFLYQFATVFENLFFIFCLEIQSRVKLINKTLQIINLKNNKCNFQKISKLKLGFSLLSDIQSKIEDKFSFILLCQFSQCFICLVHLFLCILDQINEMKFNEFFNVVIFLLDFLFRLFLLSFACDRVTTQVSLILYI